jgi:hypothetical protein
MKNVHLHNLTTLSHRGFGNQPLSYICYENMPVPLVIINKTVTTTDPTINKFCSFTEIHGHVMEMLMN